MRPYRRDLLGDFGRSAPGGFTLLELIGLIATTLVLAAVLFSAFRTHTARAQIAGAILRAAAAQEHVETAFRAHDEPPADRRAAGMSHAADRAHASFEAMAVVDGRIDIHFGARADAALAGRTLSLTPYETAEREVVWICGNAIPGPGLKPLGFFGGGRRAIQVLTTVEPRYLPSTCR